MSHPSRTSTLTLGRYALHAMSSPATDTVRISMSWNGYVDYDLGERRAEYIDGALVDPEGPELVAYELTGGEDREVGRFGPNDVADLDAGPGPVRFRPADLVA